MRKPSLIGKCSFAFSNSIERAFDHWASACPVGRVRSTAPGAPAWGSTQAWAS